MTRLSDQYDVSRSTIQRDAQLADAITAIGRTSPDAKRDILARKARISKTKLLELSAGPEEDIIEVATSIENGTFKAKNTDTQTQPESGSPADLILKGMRTMNKVIKNGDKFELKLEIKSLMDLLEICYKQV